MPVTTSSYATSSVILSREHLLYDADYESWKVAKIHLDLPAIQGHVSIDEEADHWLERQIETVLGLFHERLHRYIMCEHNIVDNRMMRGDAQYDPTPGDTYPDNYVTNFAIPNGRHVDMFAVMTYMHNAIVWYILWRWFLLCGLGIAAEYKAMFEGALEKTSSLFKATHVCAKPFIL